MQLANAVAFALLQTVLRWQSFVLSFHDGEGHGLGSRGERATENVIGATSRSLARLMIDDVNGLGGFLDANIGATVPAPVLKGGINQLKSGLGFVAGHQWERGEVWTVRGCARWPERDTLPAGNCAFVPPMTKRLRKNAPGRLGLQQDNEITGVAGKRPIFPGPLRAPVRFDPVADGEGCQKGAVSRQRRRRVSGSRSTLPARPSRCLGSRPAARLCSTGWTRPSRF